MKAWLSANRVPFDERDLLTQPPSRDDLARYARATPGGAREMVTPNTHFPEYQEHIAGKNLSDDQIVDLLARVPNLLRKPVLVDGKRILQGIKDPERLAAFVKEMAT